MNADPIAIAALAVSVISLAVAWVSMRHQSISLRMDYEQHEINRRKDRIQEWAEHVGHVLECAATPTGALKTTTNPAPPFDFGTRSYVRTGLHEDLAQTYARCDNHGQRQPYASASAIPPIITAMEVLVQAWAARNHPARNAVDAPHVDSQALPQIASYGMERIGMLQEHLSDLETASRVRFDPEQLARARHDLTLPSGAGLWIPS